MHPAIGYIQARRSAFVDELKGFLRIPSVSTKAEHAPDMRQAAEWLTAHMTGIGLEHARVLPTAGHPVVYADWLHAPGKPTVLIYGHYDVQPAEPLELWMTGPFDPTVRKGELFARGAVDDKGQVFMHLKAIEAHLKTQRTLPVNVKLLIEGEEEIGSPSLGAFIAQNLELLKADTAVISDTAMIAKGAPGVTVGLRGLVYFQLDVEGAKSDLHSGGFGGAVENPAFALAQLLARLKDRNGRITIPGFYDDVRRLPAAERRALATLPFSDRQFLKGVGAPGLFGEKGFTTLERLWARPTLEVNGLCSGFIGEGAKTVLPCRAMAKVSMRLVPNQDPNRIARLFAPARQAAGAQDHPPEGHGDLGPRDALAGPHRSPVAAGRGPRHPQGFRQAAGLHPDRRHHSGRGDPRQAPEGPLPPHGNRASRRERPRPQREAGPRQPSPRHAVSRAPLPGAGRGEAQESVGMPANNTTTRMASPSGLFS